jgi:hypothetical protein
VLFFIWAPVEDIGCGTGKLITAEPPKVRIVHIRIHQSPLYEPMRRHFNSLSSRVKSRGQECPRYTNSLVRWASQPPAFDPGYGCLVRPFRAMSKAADKSVRPTPCNSSSCSFIDDSGGYDLQSSS